MKLTDTLNERGTTHGNFTDNARVSQELKNTLHCENADLSYIQREALDMICHKLARIVAGNPNYIDAWRDIAGYAQLVVDRLKETPGALDVEQKYIEVPTEALIKDISDVEGVSPTPPPISWKTRKERVLKRSLK